MTTQIKGNATSTFGGNVDVTGNVITDAPAFSAWNSIGQTVSGGTFTKILFDTELWDTNNNFANSRFTPTVAGYYQINCGIYTVTSQATMFPIINVNGASFKQGFYGGTVNGAGLSGQVYLNGTTDYVEAWVFMNLGGALYVVNSSFNWFDGYLARAV
jgi:hypothetical protein